MKNIKVIFIPGNGGGSTKDNWFPWLKNELKKLKIRVIDDEFPDSKLARAKYWIPFLDKLGADKNTILIGHSSGAVAAMRYAESHQLLGSILVGACFTDLGEKTEKLSGYYNKKWHWDKIKKSQNYIIQFASENDPWIPIKEARFIHEKLNTEYFEFKDQGHFGGDYYKETFPELLNAIKTKL